MSDKPTKKTERVEKPAASPSEAPKPGAPSATGAESKATPKRAVLKTLKRVATPPPPPTLHRVTGAGGVTRRVIPKAPPRPAPVIPPPEPPKPVEPVVAVTPPAPATPPPPAPVAKPIVKPAAPPPPAAVPTTAKEPAAPPKPATPVVDKDKMKREPAKLEPTATYKMPSVSTMPIKSGPRPPAGRPAQAPTSAPASAASAVASSTGTSSAPVEVAPRKKVRIPEVITVKDLSEKIEVKSIEVIKKLLALGTMVTINQQIDVDTATLAADAFNIDVEVIPAVQEGPIEEKEDPALLKPRSPIVTIMGHVDHGKTSLLDMIRKTRVAEKEAGGITQHIGAYRVPTSKGDVVFLDTPGHEAFTAMRARGAQVTDIVVLVVAADDGVMPQTIEAIDHARAAGVPIVVAVNKIDLPTANPDKIKRELSELQLMPEDWGGKTIFVEVSAKKGTNVDKLLEMLALESELLELKANPDRKAQGVIIEARLDARRGVTATLMVQRGTLRVGDAVVAGVSFGRIKALVDDRGNRITEAPPATPVEVLGLSTVPQAGDRFAVLADEREARAIVEKRQLVVSEEASRRKHVTLETLHQRVAEGKMRELKIILKADVQGSIQAIRDSLERISTTQIRLTVIHAGVGGINETDVALAAASDAVIIGFNVRPDAKAEDIAKRDEVDIKIYRIIYEAIEDVRAAMEGLLEPESVEVRMGLAEVRQVFTVSRGGTIAGSMVLEGKITRGAKARLTRGGKMIHEGPIESLKRFKDDARDVEKGFECGIGFGNFPDVKPQDVIEAYTIETKARRLENKA